MASIRKVLIVDDEAPLVQLCQFLLENEGYHVSGTTSGHKALHMIAEEMPDVVVLDVMMPVMNGIEVCRRIRTQYPERNPVILMYTADSSVETERRSLAAGADGVLTKDSLVRDLPARVGAYLS